MTPESEQYAMLRLANQLVGMGAALLMCTASHAYALNINQDPKPNDYFFGRAIAYPVQHREKVFRPDRNKANFTFFHGVENVTVTDGRLAFTLNQEQATLGWGNYLGGQPVAEIEDMWQQIDIVQLRVRQSKGRSSWTVRLWRDGQRLKAVAQTTLESGGWQKLDFKRLDSNGANPDGLEFTVTGEKGTRIELEWVKLVQPRHEGYCRAEFDLPEGKVWRAVADVGSANQRHWYGVGQMASQLHINGRVVRRRGARHLYHTDPVDIAPYLQPGRNCVGFYGLRFDYPPLLYFQARIIMQSGEVVTVRSGPDWKYSQRYAEGWDKPGFDDSSWTNTKAGSGLWPDARDVAFRLGLPAYSGRLVMKNPMRKDLFYSDTADVVVDVHVPRGLKTHRPILSYLLGRADAGGKCELVSASSVSSFAESGDSLVYRLNLGRHSHGVYALALSLKDGDGTVIEERTREPLVVLRKMELKRVDGKEYTQGLDLELEDVVDFTDPRDPHPWIESKRPAKLYGQTAAKVETPVIVRKNGLMYREVADSRRGSGFSYRIQFQHPGSFYLLELEYPDDAKRIIEVSISSKMQGVWTNSQSGVGAETGGRFLPTGKMLKLRWIHVADDGPHSVDVINVADGEKAAVRSLKIYRIRGDLTSVASGSNRRYGIHTERCFSTSGIGMNFGVGMPRNRKAMQDEDKKWPLMQSVIKDLLWMEETTARYVQYLKFAGQNCHVMGCIQYSEYNTPYVAAPNAEDSRILHCMRTMLANQFEMNGIDFYAGVEFSQSMDVRSYANNAQVAKGADTIWMVDEQGRQRYGYKQITVMPNWLHPEVRRKYRALMESLCDTFGHLRHFRGVHGLLGPTAGAGYWIPSFGSDSDYDQPLVASYDDLTMAQFAKETGTELPIPKADPKRFEKRASLLQTPALRRRFIAWRGEKVKEFFAETVGTLKHQRDELEFVNALAVEDPKFFQYLVESKKTFKDVMKEFAIDLDRLNTVEGLSTGRWTLSWRQTRPKFASQDPYCWLARTSPDIISAFERDTKRYVFVRTSWDENMLATGGYAMKDRNDHDRLVESDWIMNGQKIRALPQPGGYQCREAFIQAIITADPNLLLGGFTDININVGHEQMLRSVLKTYTRLPKERFRPVLNTGLDTNFAIRQLTLGDESWFYVANPCQWPVTGSLSIETDGEVADLVNGKRVAGPTVPGATQLPIRLTPFGLAAFRVNSSKLIIKSYQTELLPPEPLARLEHIPVRVAQLLADPEARLSLSLTDRTYMNDALAKVRKAIADGQYALAWSLMTHHRFWGLWQDFLEKAAAGQTRLPDSVDRRVVNTDAHAQIDYRPDKNCVWVVGFPEEAPATMDTVLAADKKNRWGKVTYDKTTDTYTLDAALWIGDEEANGTFFQIGGREHPNVTVIVRGSVWIRPPKESTTRSDGRNSVINRLTLGDPDDDTIRATLKFDCQTPGQHGLFIGYRSPDSKRWTHRGALHVYNSTITAARQDADHVWGRRDSGLEMSPGWYASEVQLSGATLSWFEGCMTYGIQSGILEARRPVEAMRPNPRMRIEGTTFEHGGIAVQNGIQYLESCVFRNLEIAIAEGGALGANLANCTFRDNRQNWTLGSMQSRGIVMLDCRIGPQSKPVTITKNRITPARSVAANVPVYPACVVRESLLVKVIDEAGQPLPDATVIVTCEEAPQEVTRGASLTDENGLTPADPERGAILITLKRYQATDDPRMPQTTAFSYEMAIRRKRFKPRTITLSAGQPIPRPLVIKLESKEP